MSHITSREEMERLGGEFIGCEEMAVLVGTSESGMCAEVMVKVKVSCTASSMSYKSVVYAR